MIGTREALRCLGLHETGGVAKCAGVKLERNSRAGSTGPGSAICPRGTGTKPNLP